MPPARSGPRRLQLLLLLALVALVACQRGLPPRRHDPPHRPHGHFVNLRGIRIYYEDRGHGAPLFLLHGGVGNGMQFDRQAPVFEKTHRLIVPDA